MLRFEMHLGMSGRGPDVSSGHSVRDRLPTLLRTSLAGVDQHERTALRIEHALEFAQHPIPIHPMERLRYRSHRECAEILANFFGVSAAPFDVVTARRL